MYVVALHANLLSANFSDTIENFSWTGIFHSANSANLMKIRLQTGVLSPVIYLSMQVGLFNILY